MNRKPLLHKFDKLYILKYFFFEWQYVFKTGKDLLSPNNSQLLSNITGTTVSWSHLSHTSDDTTSQLKKWRVNDSADEFSDNVAGTVNKYKIPVIFPSAENKITVTACISKFDETERGDCSRESEPSKESTIITEGNNF